MEGKDSKDRAACKCPFCDEEVAFCADLPVTCQSCSIVIVACSSCGGPVREGSETCPSCGGKP